MKDGDYFKKDKTFNEKISIINKFEQNIKGKTVNKENIVSFFNEIFGYEVSKPTMALYLSSLLKARLLGDLVELETWNNGYTPNDSLGIKNIENLPEFIIPKYIKEGLVWLITD
jgi:hypothetical protein